MKRLKIFTCLGVMFLLSGCTALLWGGNKVAEPKTERHIQIQDSVTGVFQYKNLAVSAVQGSKKAAIKVPSEGVAFVGEKNIYILTQGADELLFLNKLATQIPLISGREENTLKFRINKPSGSDSVLQFSDALPVEVNKSSRMLSTEELKTIQTAGFKSNGVRYVKDVYITGVIIPKASVNYTFDKTESLGRAYNVQFYSLEAGTDFHPVNLATNIVITPLALSADIVFFPISLQFLRLMMGPH
ncbi:hypothetical protein I7V27_12410 [Lelliottia amnigena]|uniref:Lipoprotein n=1 Tax=Lelliottia amnigena TaxID=61646 RepID=A0AAP2AFJ6_LELAM|nr:hypothetical protein [Lelliottia amnigena]MBL5899730.1 hypothetical protein [Lelliottia amnigena]MBL5935244.1 hypothetical protein [Lelliottia amnigena]